MSTSETTYDAIPEPRVVPSHFFLQTPLSVLHELFSRCGLACEYDVISRPTGHCSDFVMQASVANLKATGKGCTKRAAKQSAIVHLLKALFRCSGTKAESLSSSGNASASSGDSFPNSAVDALQKFCDANQWAAPTYHAVSRSSTDQGDFVVTCVVKNTAVTGTGMSKKLAKKHAAFKMLFYQLSCVHSKSCRDANSGKKPKRGEPATSGTMLKSDRSERSESGKKKAKKVPRAHETSCSQSDEGDAAKSTTSEMNSEVSFDGSESVDSIELRKKSPPDARLRNNQLGGASNGRKTKGKQTLNKEKLAPEDARQWLSTLLLKNMNLSNPHRILKPSNSDNSDNLTVGQTATSSSRNTAGADADSALNKFPVSAHAYQFDDAVSSDEAIKFGDELKDPASEPIQKLPPLLPASSVTMTRSLPEFSPDFMDDAMLALPQSLSFENQAQKCDKLVKSQEEKAQRSSGGTTNEAPAAPACSAPRCVLGRWVPRFTWVESDMVVLERYAWGTSVYMLPRFLAAVVLVVELLLGLLYLCTDHVSSTELVYTFLVLVFLMFLLRAS